MGYSHVRVSEVKTDWNSDMAGAVDFVDGYPTTKELRMFAEEVRRKMPKVKFIPQLHLWGVVKGEAFHSDVRLAKTFHVYIPDQIFVLGEIGYGNFSVNSTDNSAPKTYMVQSRKINNEKYGDYRDQFYMTTSSTLPKAVRSASTYLSPYSIQECAKILSRSIKDNVSSTVSDAKAKVHILTSPIRNSHTAIMKEFENLRAQGVKFITAEFQELERRADEVLENYKERTRPRLDALYIHFRNIGEDTYVDVCEFDSEGGSQPTTILMSELPPEIQGKVSVLSILTNGQYVENVGERVDATTYWVLK